MANIILRKFETKIGRTFTDFEKYSNISGCLLFFFVIFFLVPVPFGLYSSFVFITFLFQIILFVLDCCYKPLFLKLFLLKIPLTGGKIN